MVRDLQKVGALCGILIALASSYIWLLNHGQRANIQLSLAFEILNLVCIAVAAAQINRILLGTVGLLVFHAGFAIFDKMTSLASWIDVIFGTLIFVFVHLCAFIVTWAGFHSKQQQPQS